MLQVRVLPGAPIFRARVKIDRTSMVGVAQLVEPRVVIPVVVGSSPIVHPNSLLERLLKRDRFKIKTRYVRALSDEFYLASRSAVSSFCTPRRRNPRFSGGISPATRHYTVISNYS